MKRDSAGTKLRVAVAPGLAWVIATLVLGACVEPRTGSTPSATTPRSPSSVSSAGHRTNAVVTRVVDGDTIHVEYRRRDVDVRLIGVDTPETVAPGQPVECEGSAASRFTERQLDGERIRLEFDVQRIDPYGRTLAYVWLGGRLFNRTLVARGYAQVATYPPDVKYVDVFLAA